MEDKQEILRALETIKGVCKLHVQCGSCPLSKNDYCVLLQQEPENWKIRCSEPSWTAFED